jgi:hypothetical protein
MGRIKGHYEWDDDDLTPGRKREGGLHQNLFDSKGNLRGNARFVPDDGSEQEPLVVTETVYVPVETRRRTQEEEALTQAITELLATFIYVGIAKATPVVGKWLRDTARPAIAAKRAQVRQRLSRPKGTGDQTVVAGTVVECSHELSEGPEPESRPDMSSAEAKARYLAALAARAYSDEQMRLVANANIVDGEDLAQLQHSLAELPPDQVKRLIESMVTNPALLGEEALAHLASLLGRRELS